MSKVIFTGYFNISFLFASIKIPIIVMYGQIAGVENRIKKYLVPKVIWAILIFL